MYLHTTLEPQSNQQNYLALIFPKNFRINSAKKKLQERFMLLNIKGFVRLGFINNMLVTAESIYFFKSK